MAISLLNRYQEKSKLVEQMAELAEEEMGHFRLVLKEMSARGITLTRDNGRSLFPATAPKHSRAQEPFPSLLDMLIVCSLIKARSWERFQLTIAIGGRRRSCAITFYRSLLKSEARHQTVFSLLSLARLYFPSERGFLFGSMNSQKQRRPKAIVASLQHTAGHARINKKYFVIKNLSFFYSNS